MNNSYWFSRNIYVQILILSISKYFAAQLNYYLLFIENHIIYMLITIYLVKIRYAKSIRYSYKTKCYLEFII